MKVKYTLFFLCTLLFSCGTKKRTVSKVENEQTSEVANNIKVKETESIKLYEVKTFTLDDFIGKIADSSRPATVSKEVKDGKTIYIFDNFKEVQASKNNGTIQSTTISDKVAETLDKSVKKDVVKQKSKDVKVDVKRGVPFWWWLILAVVVLLYLYSKKLKII